MDNLEHAIGDNNKQRLVDPGDIIAAIKILRLRGIQSDQLTREITRLFYVDLDTYNEIFQAA